MLYVFPQEVRAPQINLAIEEYLLRNVQESQPILLFYINKPSVIIGRNQNALEEIDPDYVKTNDVQVVRRLSGGGAVYHDLGNLNFSFITNNRDDLHDFSKFINPVVDVLRSLGVNAELHGKSDIFVAGKKVSGNAQYATTNRMFSHGTILFDTNIEEMLKVLNPRQIQIESKAVQSVRNVVTNVREHLAQDMTLAQLRQALTRGIFGTDDIPTYALDDDAWDKIHQISVQRYANWSWNIGRSPDFNIQKSEELAIGKVDVRIQVNQGIIHEIKFYGTFFSQREVLELESMLKGLRYEKMILKNTLAELDLTPYFGGITHEELLALLY